MPAAVPELGYGPAATRHPFRGISIKNIGALPGRLLRAVAIRINGYRALASARPDSLGRLRRARARRVLVVCYGNIYRSAFVGALLRQRLEGLVEVRSTGFHPKAGRPSPERHVELCRRFGVSLEQHRSSVISPADLEWADLVVLMDRHNWAALTRAGADQRKLVWLGSLISGPVEIKDPYRMTDTDAERIVQRLSDAALRLAERLTENDASAAR